MKEQTALNTDPDEVSESRSDIKKEGEGYEETVRLKKCRSHMIRDN